MNNKPKVTFIPATTPPSIPDKKVVIYARVSSNSTEQLKALSYQISNLTQTVSNHPGWKLRDIFIDVHTSKVGSSREQFLRLMHDARMGLIDIVLSTTITRFGRDSVEVLSSLNSLRACDVRVIFENDGLDSFKTGSSFLIDIYAAIAQAENESRSSAIKWGHERLAEQGKSKFYNRPTYGYTNTEDGLLKIVPAQAEHVKLIFHLYLFGCSILGIIRELKSRNIKSPTGKDSWNKRSIDTMLSNEKYTGRVIIMKNDPYTPSYEYKNHHEGIISEEIFAAVQYQKEQRSNMEDGKRKSSKYSSKKKSGK